MSIGSKVQAQAWSDLESHFSAPHVEPILGLVQLIKRSPSSTELYGAQSMWTLLISNEPEFAMFGNAIHVNCNWGAQKLSFKHHVNPGPKDSRVCDIDEGEATLRLFLKYKYGVLLN